nr:unnamed protein product [Callosobruchus analis]CAI5850775.1 unnamed protein product [Callosobruchus analis]
MNIFNKTPKKLSEVEYGIRKYDHISHKVKHAIWLNTKNRRLLHSACLYYSVQKSDQPLPQEKVKFRTETQYVNLRSKHLLTQPIHYTEQFKRFFS